MKKITLESRRAFITEASKIVHERHGHLEFFSRPLVMGSPREYLLL